MKGIDPELAAWGMANDPEFAKYAQSQIQGRQLAKAHAGVEDFLKQRELQRQETFRNTPSDVPIPMRAPEYQPPSGIEQWRERNNAMLASGNPFLQERAAKQMDKGYDAGGSSAPNAVREYQYALGQGFKGTFADWKSANRATTTIQMGGNTIKKDDAANMVDKNGDPVKVPVGMTYAEAGQKGWSFGKIATAEEAKGEGSFAASEDMLNRLMHLTDTGGADLSGLSGAIEDYRSGSDIGSIIVDKALDEFGVTATPENVEALALTTSLGNQLLQAFRGASVGPEEKKDFIKQLPTPGQPDAVFKANLRLTQQNLKTITERKRAARGYSKPDEPSADSGLPPGFTWSD